MGYLKRLLGRAPTKRPSPLPPTPSPTFSPSQARAIPTIKLLEPNVPKTWIADREWPGWPSPGALVVGESHHYDGIAPHVGPARECGYCVPVNVTFRRDPDNAVDPNAIAAFVSGQLVGYIDRDRAARWARGLDTEGVSEFVLAGVILGGYLDEVPRPREHSFGVFVWPTRRLTRAPSMRIGSTTYAWPPLDGADIPPPP